MNRNLRGRILFSFAVLSLLLVFALYPILVLVFNSVKTAADMALNPLGFPRAINVDIRPGVDQGQLLAHGP